MYISNNTNIFDGKDDGLYKKFTKNGTWFSTTKWKITMDTPIIGQYIIFIKRGFGNLTIYDIRALGMMFYICYGLSNTITTGTSVLLLTLLSFNYKQNHSIIYKSNVIKANNIRVTSLILMTL